jgi:hypothetical protein
MIPADESIEKSMKEMSGVCAYAAENPGCPFIERIIIMETNMIWLKKRFNIQMIIEGTSAIGVFASLIGLITKLQGIW